MVLKMAKKAKKIKVLDEDDQVPLYITKKKSNYNNDEKVYFVGTGNIDPYYCLECKSTHGCGGLYKIHEQFKDESVHFESFKEYAERYDKLKDLIDHDILLED